MNKLLVLVLIASGVFAQSRPARRTLGSSAEVDKTLSVSPGYVPQARPAGSVGSRGGLDAAATPAATTLQAPGVLQIDLGDPSRSSWFVSTETIPSGSVIVPFIIPPGSIQQFLQLQSTTLTSDLNPGTSLMLPQIRNLGDFWPSGVMTYDVLVRLPNGTNTHAAADFCTNCARTFPDVQAVVPLIYDNFEALGSDTSVLVTAEGVFTADPVKVTFEGLAVPQAAISRGKNNSVVINASLVPGMHLDLNQRFLLTISQNGWADTQIFTHVPFQPGTYVPSP